MLFVFVILLCVCNGARTIVYTQLNGCSGYISCCTSVIGLPSSRCDAAGRSVPHVNCFIFDVVLVLVAEIFLSFVSNVYFNLALYMMQASYIELFSLYSFVCFVCILMCVGFYTCFVVSHFVVTTQVLSNFACSS